MRPKVNSFAVGACFRARPMQRHPRFEVKLKEVDVNG